MKNLKSARYKKASVERGGGELQPFGVDQVCDETGPLKIRSFIFLSCDRAALLWKGKSQELFSVLGKIFVLN